MVNVHDIWHGSDSYQCRDGAIGDGRRGHVAGDVYLHNYVQYFINEITFCVLLFELIYIPVALASLMCFMLTNN